MEIVMQALNHGVIMTTARDYTGATKYMVQYGLQFTVFDSFREALQDYTDCVTHSHTTGDVRGLLCSNCNRGIGLLQNSVELVRNAYHYLTGKL